MSDIEIIVVRSKEIEQLLRKQYRAEGQEMDQLISSCEERLPHDIVFQLRFIATIKDRAVNEESFIFDDKFDFIQAYKQCMLRLTPRSGRFIWRIAFLLMCFMTAMSLLFYYINWESVEPHLFK